VGTGVSTVRYSSKVVARARELHDAGWSLGKIRILLAEELGCAPGRSTLHSWLNPASLERSRTHYRPRERARKVATAPQAPRAVTPERALERMRLLRERGCSYKAIALVAAVWWGEIVSEDTVRYRLRHNTTGWAK
jgi:hypothetical protein